MSVEKITQELESELVKAKKSFPVDMKLLSLLFAPTGVVQETAMDNGWAEEFLRISEIVDEFTSNEGS